MSTDQEKLAKIKSLVRAHHLALDMGSDEKKTDFQLACGVQGVLNMPWKPGEELARANAQETNPLEP